MKRKICRINLTVTDVGDHTNAEGHVEFHGRNEDMIHTLAHIFTAFELDPKQAILASVDAAGVMRQEADDE